MRHFLIWSRIRLYSYSRHNCDHRDRYLEAVRDYSSSSNYSGTKFSPSCWD